MFKQKRLKCLFQYTLLAGSIFSTCVYANEINIQIKIGKFSEILRINTVNLSESPVRRDANLGNLDVIDHAAPLLDDSATLPTSVSTLTYRQTNIPVELTVTMQTVPTYPHAHESGNDDQRSLAAASLESPELHQLTMTEIYPWEFDEWGFPDYVSRGQRYFRLSFQLPFFSIIPMNREGTPIRLTEEYFSVRFYILFTGNTLTRLRIDYSPERGLWENYAYTPNNNDWQSYLQRFYQGARQLALYLPMIFAQLNNRLFTNPIPPVTDGNTENSTL